MFLRSVLLQESRNMFEKDFTEKKPKLTTDQIFLHLNVSYMYGMISKLSYYAFVHNHICILSYKCSDKSG